MSAMDIFHLFLFQQVFIIVVGKPVPATVAATVSTQGETNILLIALVFADILLTNHISLKYCVEVNW